VVLSAADLFLNASLEESFGQTLLEAAACGVPSVAIARGGVTDIARDGENAVTVGSEDPAEFAAAAIRLAGDERLRARLGQGGRDLVEREFTLARQAARWREALAAGSPWPTG
jgi:glycosyltransferase involved in cell wall biosynthesis